MGSPEGRTVPVFELNHVQGNADFSDITSERSHEQRSKVLEIVACCQGPRQHDQLARLATSANGLVDDEVRRLACMFGANLFDKPF